MILLAGDPRVRVHLAAAIGDHLRRCRRDGIAVPAELAALYAALRSAAASSGQDSPGAAAAGEDGAYLDGQAPVLLAPAAAAARLGVSVRTLRRYAAAGEVACVAVNGRRKYAPGDLEAYVKTLPDGKRVS